MTYRNRRSVDVTRMPFNFAVHGWCPVQNNAFGQAIFRLLGATQSIRKAKPPPSFLLRQPWQCHFHYRTVLLRFEDFILLVHISDCYNFTISNSTTWVMWLFYPYLMLPTHDAKMQRSPPGRRGRLQLPTYTDACSIRHFRRSHSPSGSVPYLLYSEI